MEVRSIITEALSRSNVVPRRQPAPGDLVQSAYQLLKGLVSQLNNDNYLSFTQRQIDVPAKRYIHIYDEVDTLKGDFNLYFDSADDLSGYEITEQDYEDHVWAMITDGQHDNIVYSILRIAVPGGVQYQWQPHVQTDGFNTRYQQMLTYCQAYHLHVPKVSKLNTLMVKVPTAGMDCIELHFSPRDQFDKYYRNELAWTYVPLAEGEWLIETKAYAISGTQRLRLSYNEGIKFDLDSDLRVPDAYLELIIVSLTYKLAVKYPRMDDAQLTRLAAELQTMMENVATPKADVKMVKREDLNDVNDYSYWGIIGGRYLL